MNEPKLLLQYDFSPCLGMGELLIPFYYTNSMKAKNYFVRPRLLDFLRDSIYSPRWAFKLVKVWVGPPHIIFISGAYP